VENKKDSKNHLKRIKMNKSQSEQEKNSMENFNMKDYSRAWEDDRL
jgi:hypothetical protein